MQHDLLLLACSCLTCLISQCYFLHLAADWPQSAGLCWLVAAFPLLLRISVLPWLFAAVTIMAMVLLLLPLLLRCLLLLLLLELWH